MADTDGQPQRKRARQACLQCNARRVKCNVTERQPCDNCVAGNTACETRESRRGKHPRPSKKRRSESVGGQHADEVATVAGAHVLASMHRNRGSEGLVPDLTGFDGFDKSESHPSPRQPDSRQEEEDGVFLGESTALRYVTDEHNYTPRTGYPSPKTLRLRHSVPNAVKADFLIPQWEAERRRARIDFLRSDGAFSLPSPNVVEGLMQAYFKWFHPCFAIVDESDIWMQHRHGVLSPLLLQSILFIGVLHCDEAILQELACGTRHRAKYIFYNRAKDIYDAEFETKKITVIQALFLMSFWRAGALLEKDTRHWLGCAITLAQTKALHRSAGKADSQSAKLRKRIWWSLYTRDRQCAAALGLPNRVRDEDCDFESLEISDFDHAFSPTVTPKQAEEYASYAVAMTELATLLGQVVHSGYLPNKYLDKPHRVQMRDELISWKQRLPPEMQPDNDLGQKPGFHANMVHLAYNNLLILLYRQSYLANEGESRDGDAREADGEILIRAAGRNSGLIEDMLSESTLRHAQIHVITNLFNTLCIQIVHLRRSDGTTRTVAESRAKLCLLGLKELQKTWEVTNWVLQLFFQYLDRSTAARLRVQEDEGTASTSNGQVQLPPEGAAIDFKGIPSVIPESDSIFNTAEGPPPAATPWSWTSEEANHFLFSQIENDFAFGEGEMLNWSPEETQLGNALFQPTMEGNFLP